MDKKANHGLAPEEKNCDQEKLDRITEWMNNVIIRADRAVDAYLDEMLERIKKEKEENHNIPK
jgi:hypothetical protein